MANRWEVDDCAAIRAHYALYSIPRAAALWCGVPEDQLDEIVGEARQRSESGLGRSIWCHPAVPCLEPRSRAIAEAIENGVLPCVREHGAAVSPGEQISHERRHVHGRDLKAWLETAFPNERPAFLFDDIERSAHTAISADAYRALKAERDKLATRLENVKDEYKKLREEKERLESERDSLKAIVERGAVPRERAEATYQNMIAALLDCIDGKLPDVERHPSFPNDSRLIDAIDEHFRGYGGLSKSNLSRKLPECRRTLRTR